MALPPIDYHFEADVFVDELDWGNFTQKYPNAEARVVECMESVGFTLVRSLVKYGQTSRNEPQRHGRVYYNYWRIGSQLNALPDGLRLLADDPFWAEFCTGIYKEEEKEIILPLSQAASANIANFASAGAKYLLIQYDLHHFAVPLFRARLEEETARAGVERGWLLGQGYVYLTGVEGRVVQIWLVPEGTTFTNTDVQNLSWCRSFGTRSVLKASKVEFFTRSQIDVPHPNLAKALGA